MARPEVFTVALQVDIVALLACRVVLSVCGVALLACNGKAVVPFVVMPALCAGLSALARCTRRFAAGRGRVPAQRAAAERDTDRT